MRAEPRLVQVHRRPDEGAIAPPLPEVRRILVVPPDRLGDLVLGLPAVAALRRTYAGAWTGVLVRRDVAPLADLSPAFDEVLERSPSSDGDGALLLRFRPTLLIVQAPTMGLAVAARRASVPCTVGPAGRSFSGLFDRRAVEPPPSSGRHQVEVALAYAHAAGARPGPASFPLSIPEAPERGLDHWMAAQGIPGRFVVLHPGRGGSSPGWPLGHFLRLAALLQAEGVAVVVTVGPVDGAVWDALDAADPPVRRLPRLSADLTVLAALIRRAAVVVGNTSGPIHLAAALGTATLAFHPPDPLYGPARCGPYADNGWALVAEPERPPWWRRRRTPLAPGTLAGISPAAALACVLDLLERRPPVLG